MTDAGFLAAFFLFFGMFCGLAFIAGCKAGGL